MQEDRYPGFDEFIRKANTMTERALIYAMAEYFSVELAELKVAQVRANASARAAVFVAMLSLAMSLGVFIALGSKWL